MFSLVDSITMNGSMVLLMKVLCIKIYMGHTQQLHMQVQTYTVYTVRIASK